MRAHPEPIGHYSPVARPPLTQAPDSPPIVLFVVPEPQRGLYAGDAFTRVYAHSSADAVRHVTASRPRVAVVDWDIPALGGLEVCAAARARPSTSVLVTTQTVEDAPAILRAGCHALLLKPFAPNLLAARLGRLLKETDRAWGQRSAPAGW